MFSQNNEEEYILNHFSGFTGNLLDVGAYDGATFSNSRALMLQDWKGVLVEPDAACFSGMAKLYQGNSNATLVNAAVTVDQTGIIQFFSNPGALATTQHAGTEAHLNKWAGCGIFQPIWVGSLSVKDLMARFPDDYDFINIDVEGFNIELFGAFPWEEMSKCRMVCVEHDNRIPEVEARLNPLGYVEKYTNGENIILGR